MMFLRCGYVVFMVLTTQRCQEIKDSVKCLSVPRVNNEFHRLECKTNFYMIQILQASFGFVTGNFEECQSKYCNKDLSCRYRHFNKFEMLRLYRKCSGKMGNCEIQTRERFEDSGKTAVISKIKYKCLNIEKNYNELCSNRSYEKNTEPFHLVFKPNLLPRDFPNGEISSCSCDIQGLSNIEIKTVDVRLQLTESRVPTNTCSSGSLQMTTNGIAEYKSLLTCSDNDAPTFENSLGITGKEIKINLRDLYVKGLHDVPAMIWLYVDMEGGPATINCIMKKSAVQATKQTNLLTTRTTTSLTTNSTTRTTTSTTTMKAKGKSGETKMNTANLETTVHKSNDKIQSTQGIRTTVTSAKNMADKNADVGIIVAIVVGLLALSSIPLAAFLCYKRWAKNRTSEVDTKPNITNDTNDLELNTIALPDPGEYVAVSVRQECDETYNTTETSSRRQIVRGDTANIYDKFNDNKETEYDGIHSRGETYRVNDNGFYGSVNNTSDDKDFYNTTFVTVKPNSNHNSDMLHSVLSSKQDL